MPIPGGKFLIDQINPADIFTPEDFSEEHQMVANTVADFVENEVVPNIERLDHQEEGLMAATLKKAGELGLLGADIAEEYEGADMGKIASAIIAEYSSGGGS
ncbi:MAG: acyl-CoA dehydrogenase family protein, partial [Bacillota bacterium]